MSAPRDDSVYLGHLQDAISRIESYIEGVSEPEFPETPLVQGAVIRQIQVIGEAAKRLSHDLRRRAPSIPWADITGMREKLVDDFMDVDLEIVWKRPPEIFRP